MKSKTITFILTGTMLITGILCGVAFAEADIRPSFEDRQERMESKQEKRLEVMAGVLDLSESQQAQIRAIHEQERVAMEGTMEQIREGQEQMRILLESDTFDEAAIRSLAKTQAELKAEMFVSRARTKHEVFQQLTSEQQDLAKKIKPLLHKQGKHRASMRGI